MNAKPLGKPAPLGRGLSALFGDSDTAYQPRPVPGAGAGGAARAESPRPGSSPSALPVEWLRPGVNQPRREFDETAIQELASSIRERGILQPLLVRPLPGAKDVYEILAGERRWRAAQIAGLHQVPVVIRDMSDSEALEVGLIENVQRQDLTPIEEAEGYKRLTDEFGHTAATLSKVVGKSTTYIANLMRLLSLPPQVIQMVNEGQLSMGQARAIIATRDPLALAQEIRRKGLNVRQAEALAKRDAGLVGVVRNYARRTGTADTIALERELEAALGVKARLHPTGEGMGSLALHYETLDQLDDIIRRLKQRA